MRRCEPFSQSQGYISLSARRDKGLKSTFFSCFFERRVDNITPIYTETAAYAKSVGELELYRVSLHENKNCKNAIDKAISENFDGFRLKKDCYKPVIEQFGQERMLYVLANTLQLRGWDGRFSRDNKAWAEHFSIPGDPATGGEHRFLFQCESHPTVWDGFISLTRRELEKQKSSVLGALKSAASPSRDLPQGRKGIER